jgi:hypothetical protein
MYLKARKKRNMGWVGNSRLPSDDVDYYLRSYMKHSITPASNNVTMCYLVANFYGSKLEEFRSRSSNR